MPHKLLLADDSVTIQRVIELTFADEDISVIAVGDGRKAIERVQSDRPDIVLADVGMPERDGYEVAAFVKGTPNFAHIPVLLLTGAFEPIDEGRAQAAGCDGVLVKPFEPQMVISRVKDLIAGKRPVQKMPPAPALPLPSTEAVRTSAPATGAVSGSSVDEYFDRLDAAFASLDTQPSRTETVGPRAGDAASAGGPTGLGHELAHWRPEVEAGESDVAPAPAISEADRQDRTAAVAGPPDFGASSSLAAPVPSTPVPTLAEAFAALLSAERGSPVTAAAPRPAHGAAADEDLVEQVTRRVIERIGEAAVRDVVIEVAERLVAEEIARIKAAAR